MNSDLLTFQGVIYDLKSNKKVNGVWFEGVFKPETEEIEISDFPTVILPVFNNNHYPYLGKEEKTDCKNILKESIDWGHIVESLDSSKQGFFSFDLEENNKHICLGF